MHVLAVSLNYSSQNTSHSVSVLLPLLSVDNLSEGYNYLRAVVMAYGDISPESPLSLTSGSQQTTQQTTSVSTSERTTPQPDTGTHTPSTYDPFEKPPVYHYQSSNKETLQNIQNVSKSWARPHSSLSQSEVTGSVPFSGGEGQWRQGTRTPVSSICLQNTHLC